MATSLTVTGVTFPSGDVLTGIATNPDAIAGLNNTKAMTALRTAEAIAALSSTMPFSTWGSRTFTTSNTMIIPSDKEYLIIACGAGGSGGLRESGSVNSNDMAIGGNGGSVVLLKGITLSNTSLTISIGAGGAARTSTANGLVGGSTTVVGGDINISAAGGAGGLYALGSSATLTSLTNSSSSGGLIYEPGTWNVNRNGAGGNISFSGTAPFGSGGTTPTLTTTGMTGSSGSDSFNSRFIGETMSNANVLIYDSTSLIWPILAQSITVGKPNQTTISISDNIAGGNAGDASADNAGGSGSLGGGGGGMADSVGSSGAGGNGWVLIWVEK